MAIVTAFGSPSIPSIPASAAISMTWVVSGTPSIPSVAASGNILFSTTWPVSIPENFQVGGYSETEADNTIRTTMSVGPDKIRRRTTANVRMVSGVFWLTTTQYNTLRNFFENTVSYGTVPFIKSDAHGVNRLFRFSRPPVYTPNGPNNWLVKVELEEMP